MQNIEAKTKEKTYSTCRFYLPLLFIFFSIIIEMANFLYLDFRNASGKLMVLPTYFLFDLGIILILAGVIYLISNKTASTIVYSLLMLAQVVFTLVNLTLQGLFHETFTLSTMSLDTGNEAFTTMSLDMIDWGGSMMTIAIYLLAIAAAILLVKFNKDTYTVKNCSTIVLTLATFILIEAFGLGFFEVQENTLSTDYTFSKVESDSYLWDNNIFRKEAYKKFGHFGFYTNELYNLIFPQKVDDEKVYKDFISSGFTQSNPDAPLYGDNLIVVMCESLDLFAISPMLTPTLWSMWQGQNNSIALKNYHVRSRTNYSEGIAILGSMPFNSTLSKSAKLGNNFAYSMPNLFKRENENIICSYFHPNSGSFYARNKVMGKDAIGFDNLYFLENYDKKFEKWGDWGYDRDFVEYFADQFMPREGQFLSFITTLSTHGAWNKYKPQFEDLYKIYDEHEQEYAEFLRQEGFVFPTDPKMQEYLKNYIVTVIDLDNTIKFIVDELEERNLSDNTSVLMFGDHNALFQELYYTIRGISKDDVSNLYTYNIPAMIYSPKLNQSGTLDTFCNNYDLLPTICDLYGLSLNTNMMQGYSIFSDEIQNSFFTSHLGGMFDSKIYANSFDEMFIPKSATSNDLLTFRQKAARFFEKQEKIEKIYKFAINI